jgi:hypothetical protein
VRMEGGWNWIRIMSIECLCSVTKVLDVFETSY